MTVPVLTIDGPSGSGKGTVAERVATRLGWRVLDSGALYRLLGRAVEDAGIGFDNPAKVAEIADKMEVQFERGKVFLDGRDLTGEIRTEHAGAAASRVAAMPEARKALLGWQQRYAQLPGLVADGRDMGTVVFPRAALKIYLDASPEERARRRHKQLIEQGITANLADLTAAIAARDKRDRERTVAPLRPAPDARVIDSSHLGVDEVVAIVLAAAGQTWPQR